ncbi:MAG TPA: hypothetical protein DDW27_14760 [Bacteroidales bacterium]|nr:hypothetical protein [Bacteroidales bacterium]
MASEALSQLRQLALAHSRRKHPTLPEYARHIKPYSDKTANGLTRAIIDFLRFSGWQAERINCTGRLLDNTKVFTDTVGFTRKIGSVKWLPTSGEKGTSDISAVINGRAVKIEVKMRDRQSEDQKSYQLKIENAGGYYWLVRSFDEFMKFYNGLVWK